jgi:hypothetical protein
MRPVPSSSQKATGVEQGGREGGREGGKRGGVGIHGEGKRIGARSKNAGPLMGAEEALA